MIESFLEQSINPRNRAASKDHHTDLIPIPSIKHSTSFPINYKNGLITMVERDGSIACQQKSKEHETKEAKKQNNNNHQTNNLTGSKETDKNNRQQYEEHKILQFQQELQQQRNTKLENLKERLLQNQIMTQQKKKKVIIIGDSMNKKIDGSLLKSSIYCKSKTFYSSQICAYVRLCKANSKTS